MSLFPVTIPEPFPYVSIMRYGICILLLNLCILSGIANGKKFIYESDTILFENCETSDSSESDVSSLHSLLNLSGINAASVYLNSLSLTGYLYLSTPHDTVHPDDFSPPPEA